MIRARRISKAEWRALGGLRSSRVFRSANARGAWRYYLAPL